MAEQTIADFLVTWGLIGYVAMTLAGIAWLASNLSGYVQCRLQGER